MRTQRLTETEKTLVRLIDRRDTDLNLRQFAFDQLAATWPANCRVLLAYEAVLSCALQPRTELFEPARKWLAANDPDLLAVAATRLASFSPAHWQQVVGLITFQYKLPEATSELMRRICDGDQPSWREIFETIRPADWQAMPPERFPEQYDICLWVMENPSAEEIAGRASDYINHPDFAGTPPLQNLPALRQQILRAGLWDKSGKLLETIFANFSTFRSEIVEVLASARPPKPILDIRDKAHLDGYEGMMLAGKHLSDHLSELSEEETRHLIEPVKDPNSGRWETRPWLTALIPSLCYSLNDTERAIQSVLIQAEICQFPRHYFSHWCDQVNQWLNQQINTGENIFADWFCRFPDEIRLNLIERVADLDQEPKYSHVWHYPFKRLIQDGDWAYQAYLRTMTELASTGRLDPQALLTFLKVHKDKAKSLLETWLTNCQGEIINGAVCTILQTYAIPWQLPVGQLISVKNVGALHKLGYELRPEDVSTLDRVRWLLPMTAQPYGPAIHEPSPIWSDSRNYDQWRRTLIEHGADRATITRSILATSTNHRHYRDGAANWLRSVYTTWLGDRPEDRRWLCRLAWTNEVNGNLVARHLLATDDQCWLWQTESDLQLAKAYCQDNWLSILFSEPVVAKRIFSVERWRELFLEQMPRHEQRDTYFGAPSTVAHLFPDEASQQELLAWLIRHVNKFHSLAWLRWIDHFNFANHPRIRRLAWRKLEDSNLEARSLAIKAITSSTANPA